MRLRVDILMYGHICILIMSAAYCGCAHIHTMTLACVNYKCMDRELACAHGS